MLRGGALTPPLLAPVLAAADDKGPRRKKTSESSRAHYKAHATVKEQIEARTYFAKMMQVAFSEFRATGRIVTWETKWEMLFPPDPPAALLRFYGEPSGYDIAELAKELDVKVNFLKPLAPRKVARPLPEPAGGTSAKRPKRYHAKK